MEQKKEVRKYTKKIRKAADTLAFHTQLDEMCQQLEKYQ